ncbi:hypothetical protein Mal64_28420 [Pseudobythopirellula maris]|uniref:PEP-CTERM protein-sorting domain-containing protein n=1 Tax=Pseudobythopirellula maris TaxID=2527991 RepID=A0A5C5ZIW1_9BACT|nr:PEP-CTERM sorting domain-containing protein [Pseudobythopirellula maris]TWT87304.1 hypothetical protein Mal64_28420 [Pseudobythopirellula maris]
MRGSTIAALILSFLVSADAQAGLDLSDPRVEAEYLAVEHSGKLRPPNLLADQIEADLASIRVENPAMDFIRVLPNWVPGEVLVKFTPAGIADYFLNGEFIFLQPYDLGTPTVEQIGSSGYWRVAFDHDYHSGRLAKIFDSHHEVLAAEPNGIIGDGNDIVALPDRRYVFSRGWGDCPAGCINHEYFEFDLSGAAPVGMPGDYNDDGSVDGADFTVWRDHMHASAGSLPNDMIGGAIGDGHLQLWRDHFGESMPHGAATVPEPTAALLLLAAAGAAWSKRR